MLIRDATAADIPAIVKVHLVAWDAAKDGLDLETRRTHEQRTEQWGRFLEDDRGYLLVSCDPEPIGFIAFGPSRDEDRQGQTEIFTLYVAPQSWGAGVGSALMAHVPTDTPVSLWVAERNIRARRFYTRLGFSPDGAREAGHHVPVMRLSRSGSVLSPQSITR